MKILLRLLNEMMSGLAMNGQATVMQRKEDLTWLDVIEQ